MSTTDVAQPLTEARPQRHWATSILAALSAGALMLVFVAGTQVSSPAFAAQAAAAAIAAARAACVGVDIEFDPLCCCR